MADALKMYEDAAAHQLIEWVAGRPWHNPLGPDAEDVGGECCPDFSCCRPEMLAAEKTRKAYAAANYDQQSDMLIMFLLGGMAGEDKKIHIAGDTPAGNAKEN